MLTVPKMFGNLAAFSARVRKPSVFPPLFYGYILTSSKTKN